jgi:anthraniloyl-CoA monooxygenase
MHRAAHEFGTTVEVGAAKYAWFGTHAPFDAVTFPFVRTEHGTFGAHAYPYGDGMSTFIVEADRATWRRAGMSGPPPDARKGTSDEYALDFLSDVFADHLGGHPLIGNNSWWSDFHVVRNDRWWTGRHVLLGDAAHTAHFSVGSGTKLAMEDAIVLAESLLATDDRDSGLTRYEAVRRQAVARTQRAAARSMRWWETFDRRMHLPAHQFGMHFITRTAAISFAGLRRRHPDRIADAETWFTGAPRAQPHRALDTPLTLGPLRLANRVAVVLRDSAAATEGAALALLDTRRRRADLAAVADRLAAAGTALGVVVDESHRGPVTAPLVEVTATGCGLPASFPTALDRDTAVITGLTCPRADAWSGHGDRLVERCRTLADEGVAGLHLHGEAPWERMLAWADRVRTESGLAVLIDCPDGWSLPDESDANGDDWPTRLHVALISGRADMAVGWPHRMPSSRAVGLPVRRAVSAR